MIINRRVELVIEDISGLIPKIFKNCCGDIEEVSANELYANLGDYTEKIMNSMRKYFLYISDIESLYKWFGLSTEWMGKDPYGTIREFAEFFTLFDKKDGGWTIIDKITCDFEAAKEKAQEDEESMDRMSYPYS